MHPNTLSSVELALDHSTRSRTASIFAWHTLRRTTGCSSQPARRMVSIEKRAELETPAIVARRSKGSAIAPAGAVEFG
jgi:hypothetical protein